MYPTQRLRSGSSISQHSQGGHSYREAGRPRDGHLALYEDPTSSDDATYVRDNSRLSAPSNSTPNPVRQTKLQKDVHRSASAKTRLWALLQPASHRKPVPKETVQAHHVASNHGKPSTTLPNPRNTPDIPGHWPTTPPSKAASIALSQPGSIVHLPLHLHETLARESRSLATTARQDSPSSLLEPLPEQTQTSLDARVEHSSNSQATNLHGGRGGHVRFVEERLGDVRRAPELWIVRNSQIRPSLEGVLDMTSSERVDRQSITLDRPIVRETLQPVVHHIRQELISRDIHRPEVFRRILPIRDVQVNPARHFVLSSFDNSLVEIGGPPVHAPSSKPHDHHIFAHVSSSKKIVGHANSTHHHASGHAHPQDTTNARHEVNQERSPNAADEIRRTHTYNHHSPILDDEARIHGQTVPFTFHTQAPAKLVEGEHTLGATGWPYANGVDVRREYIMPDEMRSQGADVLQRSDHRAPLQMSARSIAGTVSLPDLESNPEKTPDVIPWEFSKSGQSIAYDDMAVRGGHSIASEHGQEVLRQRSTTRYKRL